MRRRMADREDVTADLGRKPSERPARLNNRGTRPLLLAAMTLPALPRRLPLAARDRRRRHARARRGPRPRRRRHVDRDHSGGHAGARRRGGAQGRRDRGPAVRRGELPEARARHRDRGTCARRRERRRQDRPDDGDRPRARGAVGRARRRSIFSASSPAIATATHEFVRRVKGTKLRICCTRKTTPGLRAIEKYAVRCGGGFNHRFGLDDAILIKDNHIAVAGGIRAVLERAHAGGRPSGQDRDRGRHARSACARCSRSGSPTWCCSTTWTPPP